MKITVCENKELKPFSHDATSLRSWIEVKSIPNTIMPLDWEFGKAQRDAISSLTAKISGIYRLFIYNEEDVLRVVKLANQYEFSIEYCILKVDGFCFVEVGHLPSSLRLAIILGHAELLNERFTSILILEAAIKYTVQAGLKEKNTKGVSAKTYIAYDKRTGFCKIGRSIDPSLRERTLQSEMPLLKIVKTYDYNIEAALHRHFGKERIRGEWFKVSVEEIDKVAQSLLANILQIHQPA